MGEVIVWRRINGPPPLRHEGLRLQPLARTDARVNLPKSPRRASQTRRGGVVIRLKRGLDHGQAEGQTRPNAEHRRADARAVGRLAY